MYSYDFGPLKEIMMTTLKLIYINESSYFAWLHYTLNHTLLMILHNHIKNVLNPTCIFIEGPNYGEI